MTTLNDWLPYLGSFCLGVTVGIIPFLIQRHLTMNALKGWTDSLARERELLDMAEKRKYVEHLRRQ